MANSYETMLREVLMEGSSRPDRTGTGTTSLFGGRIEYDLRNGFPLITSKRVPFRLVAEELLWFLRGDTDIQYLRERGVHIWDEWADSSGEIGPMYGRSWRAYGEPYVPRQELPSDVPATYLGVANGRGKEGNPLAKVWEGMVSRCYDPKSIGYKSYGGRGVQVCSRWLEFRNFAEDAPLLPGYREGRVNDDGDRLTLDKDQRGNGKLYSPDHCMWITDKENSRLRRPRTIRVEDRSGTEYVINSVTDFAEDMGFDPSNFYDLWSSKKGTWRNGYRLISIEDDTRRSVDQIAKVIQSIKEEPYSRRHVVSAWNVSELDQMALAPCHIMFQFYVEEDDVLSIQVYQRS